jgi:undecaprenyl-diphosphatase
VPPVDLEVYERLNGLAVRHHGLADVLRFFAEEGQVVFMALLGALFLASGSWRTRSGRHGVAAAGVTAVLALAVAHAIAAVWDRPRPYEAHADEAHLLLAPSPDPSFPSDHATGAYAIAFAILLRHRKAGVLALLLATLVSASRVGLGIHYPTDVLGGAALGALAALALWLPPVRRPLHRLADWSGARYDRVVSALSRSSTARDAP